MSEPLESLPDIDADVASMLAAYTAETTRAPAQIDAALQQVTAKLAIPAAATTAGATAVIAKLALAGVVVTAGAWWALRPSAPSSSAVVASAPETAVSNEQHEPAPIAADAPQIVDEPVSRDDAPVEAPVVVPPPVAKPKRAIDRPANEADKADDDVDDKPRVSLAAELRMLKEARGALRTGDSVRALERVRTHRQQFPTSPLAEERDATEVMALCALGRLDDARTMAANYERTYSRSQQPLLATCSDTPSEKEPR